MTRLPISPPAAVVTQSQEEEKFLVFSFGSFSQLDILNPVWIDVANRLEICQKIYRTEDFRVKNLHRKRVIFDIC